MYYLVALAFAAQLPTLPPDSVDRLRSRARSAEARFERLARARAPLGWSSGSGRCDEIVGRFCLRFDSTSTPPPPVEVGPVVDARRDAVEALRRYFSAAPGERDAAGPLIRLLAQDERQGEAVSAARTFAALTPDTKWAHLLLGYAHHQAGSAAAAEGEFALALAAMDEDERAAWRELEWLVDPVEWRAVRRLSDTERAEYERRFWILSDPLWLTAPNERWSEHLARQTEARLLAQVPVVTGMLPWGRDLDELAVRYGTPKSRSQIRGHNSWDPSSFIEYYDTAQRAYSPARLRTAGPPEAPYPGDPAPFYSARARSGYALGTVERVLALEHQLTRFVSGGMVVVRVDGAAPTPEGAVAARVGLFAWDTAFSRRIETLRATPWTPDTTRFTLFLRAPPGPLVYGVEVFDSAAAFAAVAHYPLPAELPPADHSVSDLLIAEPFGEQLPVRRDDAVLVARSSLVVPAGATLGIYAELYGLSGAGPDAVRIEFGLEPAERTGALGRLGRWIGRATGLAGPLAEPRVAWNEGVEDGVHPVAVNLPLDPRRRGRQLLVMRVTDLRTGVAAESRRPLRIVRQ